MSKLNSTNSYNSGTSSETSETPSVEENQPSDSVTAGSVTPPIPGSGSRIPKSWKRMKEPNNDKDGESKRPPWRAVSISTLPKPDKNALLRAKLLDASRRLRAGKVAVGVQTDIVPTKLMKEVSLGAQTDLILLKEVGVLTDGSYTKTRGGSDECKYNENIVERKLSKSLGEVFSTDLIVYFNIDGTHGKKRFKDFGNVFEAIMDALRSLSTTDPDKELRNAIHIIKKRHFHNVCLNNKSIK